jgi:hypothetical protein
MVFFCSSIQSSADTIMQDRQYTFLCAMCLMALVTGILGGIASWASPKGKLYFIGKGLIFPMALGMGMGVFSASAWLQVAGWSVCGLALLAMCWVVCTAVAKRRRTSR